jgi:hypothetical protein
MTKTGKQNARPEWALTRTVRLSRRYTVEMTCGPAGFTCEWIPGRPDLVGKLLNKEEARNYRTARDELAAQSRTHGRQDVADRGLGGSKR